MARKPTPAGAAASMPTTTTAPAGAANSSTDTGAAGGEQSSDPDSPVSGDAPTPPAAPEPAPTETAAAPAAPATSEAPADAGTATTEAPDKPIAEPVTIEVRILVDHGDHRPNDVAQLSPTELRAALRASWADDNAEAVAFAKSLAE